ncbi:MAG: CPBP family intramembrane metalloprotease [Chitinophagaceae bacterium]|nr:MAG: CPBP family intramembrane metalloprotease [Chitinophagaceae bacterium]
MAFLIAGAHSYYTVKAVPYIKNFIVEFSVLKMAAIWLAIVSGLMEEIIFRKALMDWLNAAGEPIYIQILVSSLAFGVVHTIWIFLRGEFKLAIPIVLSTSVLGLMLGALYIFSDRNLVPCIVAHAIINLIIEPGLLMSAMSGHWSEPAKTDESSTLS